MQDQITIIGLGGSLSPDSTSLAALKIAATGACEYSTPLETRK